MAYDFIIKSNDGYSELGRIQLDVYEEIFPLTVIISDGGNLDMLVEIEDNQEIYVGGVSIRTGYEIRGLSGSKDADVENWWIGSSFKLTIGMFTNNECVRYLVDSSNVLFQYQSPVAQVAQVINKDEIALLPCDEKVAYTDFRFSFRGNAFAYYNGECIATPSNVGNLIEAKCASKKFDGDFLVNVWDRPTGGLSYTLSGDQSYYICNGLGSATKTDIVIASEIDGKPVKEIAREAFASTNITSIKIPPSVERIGFACLQNCQNLVHISAPFSSEEGEYPRIVYWFGSYGATSDNVPPKLSSVAIYDYCANTTAYSAFSDLSPLTTIHLPKNCQSLDALMFFLCRSVTSMMFYGSVRQFNALPKTNNWARQLVSLEKVTCSDGYVDISQWKG